MKRLAVPALCLVLAACGFHPMYGRATGPALASVYVEPVAERDGFELRTSLIDALQSDGDERGKAYRLKITLNEAAQGIALQNDATITRYNNNLTAKYTLYDLQGNELTSGTETQMSAYNVVQSPYATQVAALDSSKRAAQDIAERIHLDLGVWFRQHRK
jgi:LPS-assembly lipoprotein